MRIASSTCETKILPSPIRPVDAALTMASITASSLSSLMTISRLILGRNSTTYSAPRYSSLWPLPAETLDLRDGQPLNADSRKSLFDLFEFEGFDDGFTFFTCFPLSMVLQGTIPLPANLTGTKQKQGSAPGLEKETAVSAAMLGIGEQGVCQVLNLIVFGPFSAHLRVVAGQASAACISQSATKTTPGSDLEERTDENVGIERPRHRVSLANTRGYAIRTVSPGPISR